MVQYGKFVLDDLFSITGTKSTDAGKVSFVKNGDAQFVGRTSAGYGIQGMVNSADMGFDPNEANTISVSQVGTIVAQYRDFPYYTSQNITKFSADFLNPEVGLYFCGIINDWLAKSGFVGYHTVTQRDLKKQVVLLPVTPAGDPDFEYMTMRIRELEAERIRELEAYLHVTGLDDTTLSASEAQALTQKVQWKKFRIGDVFDKKTVKGYPKKIEDLTSVSDGYHTFGQNIHYQHCQRIKMPDKYLFKVTRPILAYASSTGSVGMINESFYRSGDNGAFQALLPKFDDKRVTTMLFILVVMKRIFAQFNYNTNVRGILDMDILLPVTPDNEIDFNYMQNYIRAMEKQTIKGVVEYKDRVIKETKKVVND